MKRWTRKLLAGLLSFGMLLQVASPLSALAADTAELIVILKQGVTGEEITDYIGQETTRIDLGGNYKPTVEYGVDGYIITGPMGIYHSASGNGYGYSDKVTVKGVNGHTPSLKQVGPVNGDLTVENVKSFTKIGSVNGAEKINCTGDVKLETDSNVSYGLNVETQGSVTVTATGTADTLAGDTKIKCDGPVNIKNTSTGLIICTGNLAVNTRSDVTISGNCGSLTEYSSMADITAKSLTMQNDGGTVGKVKFTKPANSTEDYVVYISEDKMQTMVSLPSGDKVTSGYLRIESGTKTQPNKHTLTLTNAKAYDGQNELPGTAGENGTTTYTVENNKKLKIKAVAPDESSQWKFKNWTGRNETEEEITVTVNGNMTLIANWDKVTDPATNYGITVTIGSNSPIEVTRENCGNILGDGYTSGKLTYATNTLTGTGSFGEMKVEITSNDLEGKVDVVLRNDVGATTPVVDGALTVTGAKNVEVTGASSTALITRDATINCAGDILMDNTGSGNVLGDNEVSHNDHGNLYVENAQNVTIHGVGRISTDEYGTNYTIYGKAKIYCSGDVEITSQNGGAVWDPVVITSAANVTITAARRAVWDSRDQLDSSINCSGKVKITSENAAALYDGKLTITGATDVTISGNRNSGATIGGAADITCSGPVVLENKGSGKAVSGELKYTPTHTHKYEIKTGTTAASAEVVYPGESGTGYTGTFNDPYINIAPASSGDTTPDDTGTVDSGSGAGGAVAAVLVGSAAVWGGYEIATRVILHSILPEGTAIPANRGQLALLVWNNAGRPAPVNEPAFADMDDADMAKAAQWCVEQGIMEAKTAETFKPEGWTPKLKVIEVWNKAFPKQ